MNKRYPWWSYIKAIIRQYPAIKDKEAEGVALKEKQAVEAAVEETKAIPTGEDQLKVIDLVYWKSTHTLSGAAMQIPCHYDTARRWQTNFVKRVAKNFGILE